MTGFLDEISPPEVKERRLALSLAETATPTAGVPLVISVDYTKTLPDGVVLPLIVEVQGPSPSSYTRREYTRGAPESIIVTPKEGGRHIVTVREVAHNKWWGGLQFEAEGADLFADSGS